MAEDSPEAKTKEEALAACAEQHLALVRCYRDNKSIFGFPCQEQHNAFWDCYKAERGTGATTISATVGDWVSWVKSSVSNHQANQYKMHEMLRQQQHQQHPQQQQQQHQQSADDRVKAPVGHHLSDDH